LPDRRLKARLPVLLCALLLALPAPAALAHAVVMAAEPAPQASLAAAPPLASLRFNSRIDAGRSRLTLVDPAGTTQELVLSAAPDQPTRLNAALPRLGPGAWRLRWQVLAVDGHITRGEIPFRIRE
jgi:methionine-rich copper-binding protein CopC